MTQSRKFTSTESQWQAVQDRDQTAAGYFYYAVKTTGVYCRPGCSSRLPKRENVEFFEQREAAERAGYRPCKRCTPQTVSPREAMAEIMVQACRRIEQAEKSPTLNELAAEAGISPWHFQRTFKKMIGVTPKQYAAAHQAKRLLHHLHVQPTVTEAIYEAGFSSSSRGYDHAREYLAMTPTAVKNKAQGVFIHFGIAPCYLGWVIVGATDQGICAIEMSDDPRSLKAQVKKRFPQAQLIDGGPDFDETIAGVIDYLERPERGISLPLDIQGTAFQKRVWQALQQIPAGTTASYGEVAARIGQPNASRAVAQACAANKLAGAIPCHRVVRQDGELGGYRWGVERKKKLLAREKQA